MRISKYIAVCTLILFHYSCTMESSEKVVVQGHRGCRGLLPENSLPAFELALQTGVSTLEFDVVVSADSVVIVSHEPFMNPEICTYPDSTVIQPSEAESLNLYQMRFDSIRQYVCGTFPHPRFPEQEQIKCNKPALLETLQHISSFCSENNIALPALNIELKSKEEWYGLYQPYPEEFVRLLHEALQNARIKFNISLQSFDMNILRAVRASYSEYRLVCLNENPEITMDQLFAELGFVPEVYSPNYSMVDEALVEECAARSIGLSVWTVNEEEDMQRMLEMGVRDIITDYPARLIKLLPQLGYTLK